MSHLRSLNRSLIVLSITMLAGVPLSTTAAQDSAQEVFERATLQAEGQPMIDPVAESFDSAQDAFQLATLQAEGQRIADLSDDTTAAQEGFQLATLQAEGQVMVEGPTQTAISEP